MKKRIGKIQKAEFGMGGYQDAQFGFSVTLGSDRDSWGVCSFNGYWSDEPSENAQWSVIDQNEAFAEASRKILSVLSDANVRNVSDLVGIPVEVTFDGGTLEDWRVLTEVI